MTEMIAYTIAGIILYFASDWVLERFERSAGKRFENRSLVFFAIILFLALTTFTLIRFIVPAT